MPDSPPDQIISRQAGYWYTVVSTRCTAGAASLVDDRVCRSILADAARDSYVTGVNARMWVFEDESRLVANRDGVWVR